MSGPDGLDPDPLHVEGYSYVMGYADGLAKGRRRDRLAAIAMAGAILALLITAFAVGRASAASAAPRSGQTTERVDLSAPSSAALSGAPPARVQGPGGAHRPAQLEPASAAQQRDRVSAIHADGVDPFDTGGAPLPSPAAVVQSAQSPATSRGVASWCAPTPTRCQSWGGGAMVGAVSSFRWGDSRYRVRVCRRDDPGRCAVVTVVSFCGCPDGRVIDLSPAAFKRLAPLSAGLVRVTVARVGPGVTPPPTDVSP